MAERRKPTHQKKKRRAKRKESSFLRTALTLCFCVLAFVFSAFLWREALRVSTTEQGNANTAEQCFVTNADDVERFGSEQGCKRTARIYYEAICAYFGTTPLPDANQ